MNEHDIEDAQVIAANWTPDSRNLQHAAAMLARLAEWTNSNSDGWPYWSKPSNAARALQVLIQDTVRAVRQGNLTDDIDSADLSKALRPIRAFFTRQGTPAAEVAYVLYWRP